MSRYIKLTTMLLAVTFMVSAFTSLPVRAEESQISEPLPTETQDVIEEQETVPETTAETAIETTVPMETPPTLADGLYVDMESDENHKLSSHYINNIQDLADAFGTDNLTILSETDLCLKKDVVLPESDYIRFDSGTYNIDFRSFHITCHYQIDMFGGNVTFFDSSTSQVGGIQEPEESSTSFVVAGGSLTIQSGTYTGRDCLFDLEGGSLSIEGGRFTSTSQANVNKSAVRASTSINNTVPARLDISGGYIEVEGNLLMGLFISGNVQAQLSDVTIKSAYAAIMYAGDEDGYLYIMSGTYYGAEEGLQIVRTKSARLFGGTYSSDPKQNGSAVSYYSNYISEPVNVFSFFAEGYMFDLPMYSSEAFVDYNVLRTYTQPKVSVISSKSVEGFVDRLYSKTLDRQPDLKGFQDWITKLKAKTSTGSGVAFGFFFSPEFIKKNVSDTDFVTLMYRVFFDREPDATGKQTWLNALANGASRKYVFAGFANSKEWKSLCDQYQILPGTYASDEARDQNIGVTSFIQRLYTLCLNRKADVAGMNDWAAGLNSKQKDGAHVAYGFFFSTEFTNRKLSNEDYVEVLYKVLLGRASDSKGKADWVAQLKAGKSRLEIFRGFAHSQEFEKICSEYGIVRGTV